MSFKDPLKIELPFSGFYESWHDERIDETIRDAFTYDTESGEDRELTNEESDAIYSADVDWSATRVEYCKEYVGCFANEFGLTLEYDGLQSPKEYNFTTDRVFAIAERSEFNTKIRQVVEALPNWPAYIRERFTSRDGFWSFYSADSKDEQWTRDTLDECQYEVMLQFYIDNLTETDPHNNAAWNEREYFIVEDIDVYNFESINNAIEVIQTYLKKETVQ